MKKLLSVLLIATATLAWAADDIEEVKVKAVKGDADAQFELGVAYDEGNGVSKDREEAVAWYTKAAKQGHANAQYNLAVSYDVGEGVKKDTKEAAAWYLKAAKQGHASAQLNIGIAYIMGEGIDEDEIRGVAWVLLSAANENEKAVEFLKEKVVPNMSEADFKKATALGEKFEAGKFE